MSSISPYADFVQRTYTFIASAYPGFSYYICSDGERSEKVCQDSAILRNEKAQIFTDLIRENAALFNIDPNDYIPRKAVYCPGKQRYEHICYPKNLVRWMKGTLSRKRRCRVEFWTLLYCHAIGWGSNNNDAPEQCQ